MKIAVLENDLVIIDKIKEQLKCQEVVCFQSQYEFLDNCFKFEIALIDNFFVNKEIVDRVASYKLEIVVLTKNKLNFNNSNISVVVRYDEISTINERLKYLETKIRIKKFIEIEQKTLSTIQNLTNKNSFLENIAIKNEEFLKTIKHEDSYTFEIIDNIGILEIKDVLRQSDKIEIEKHFESVKFNIVVYFSCIFNSTHLNSLAMIWEILYQNDVKAFYWNKFNDRKILKFFRLCKLDNLFKVINTLDEIKK
jgi:hypothetical protein